MGPGKSTFTFPQNRRKLIPARSIEVMPSMWDKPKNRNYKVCGFIDGKLMWCENGLSLDSAARTVWCAAHGE